MRRSAFSSILLVTITLFTSSVVAVERHVPSGYSTIQAAIDDCNNGDVVIIEPNTYTGTGNRDIDFKGKVITVRSIDPEDPCVVAATVIDCENAEGHRGFYFHSGEDRNSVLSGLTIKNGYADEGGGIYCSGSSPTISNCKITGNSTKDGLSGELDPGGDGGGICCCNSEARILNCIITNNQTGDGGTDVRGYGDRGGTGGGIYCWNDSFHSVEIRNCTVSNNRTGDGSDGFSVYNVIPDSCNVVPWPGKGGRGGEGGGICLSWNTSAQIVGCIIRDNQTGKGGDYHDYIVMYSYAGDGGDGGGIYMINNASQTIKNCIITNNTTGPGGNCSATTGRPGDGGDGGAICSYTSSPQIENCTAVSNETGAGGTSPSQNGISGKGGGIYGDVFGTAFVKNSIIWANLATNQIYGGVNVTYSDVQGGYTGTGNINADPCFVSGPQGDYYLSQIAAGQAVDSPCVDTGSDTAANLGMDIFTTRTDYIGDANTVDMGYHYIIPNPVDIDGDWDVDLFDFAILASQWQQEPGIPSADVEPPGGDGIVNEKDLTLLVDSWFWGKQ